MAIRRIPTSKPVTLLENLWRTSTITQKRALLKARGLSLTWAKTKTIREMVNRGGGMIAKDLLNLVKTFAKRRTDIREVRFKR